MTNFLPTPDFTGDPKKDAAIGLGFYLRAMQTQGFSNDDIKTVVFETLRTDGIPALKPQTLHLRTDDVLTVARAVAHAAWDAERIQLTPHRAAVIAKTALTEAILDPGTESGRLERQDRRDDDIDDSNHTKEG